MALDHLTASVERSSGIARILFDDPEKMNRIPMGARPELRRLIEEYDTDSAVRYIILRGAGTRAFSAGGDIAGFLDHTPVELSRLHDDVSAVERCSKPVIALVDGYCLGVGFEIALASDFVLATSRSVFGLPEVTLGMIPGSGGSQRLLRILGPIRTKWFVLRGAKFSAEEGVRLGLVSQSVANDALDGAVAELIDDLSRLSPLALRQAKRSLNAGQDMPLSSALMLEGLTYGLLRSTEDFVEGVTAFQQKRSPNFGGR